MNQLQNLALYCHDTIKEGFEYFNNCETLYIEIDRNNKVKKSYTPHILTDNCFPVENKCILIHKILSVWNNGWRSSTSFKVQFITEKREVLDATTGIDANYALKIENWDKPKLKLCSTEDDFAYYEAEWPWDKDDRLQKVWDLYIKLKKIDNAEERKRVAEEYKSQQK